MELEHRAGKGQEDAGLMEGLGSILGVTGSF